jgi:hypothetical protein
MLADPTVLAEALEAVENALDAPSVGEKAANSDPGHA